LQPAEEVAAEIKDHLTPRPEAKPEPQPETRRDHVLSRR
jgi:undecaprenyl diphosphate synthase